MSAYAAGCVDSARLATRIGVSDISPLLRPVHRVDAQLNAIKGGGACQLREKVLAEAAKAFIIVADYRKESEVLGASWTQGVPIEVAEFAWSKVQRQLVKMGSTAATLRMGKMKAGPVVTDNGCVAKDAFDLWALVLGC